MSESPVPIPSGSVPADIPNWQSVDAAAWRKAGLVPWTRPLWSVLALLVPLVVAIGADPEPVCSDAVPCGPDWAGMVQAGLAVGLLYWLARLPELTLVTAPVLAVLVAWEQFPAPGEVSRAANLVVIAVLALGWAAAWARSAARREQRRLVERAAAGIRHRLPEPVGLLWRGTIPLAAGAMLCVVAAGAICLGLSGVREDERHAAGAERIAAEVISRNDVSVRVRTDDARRITVDAAFPEDYAVGTTVTVLEDGRWRRLAAEPYDAFGWQLLALAAGLPGISLLTTGVLARRRSAALRRGPVPALRVLGRVDLNGRTWVHAADDASGSTPLFSCLLVQVLPDEDQPDEGEYDEEGWEGEDAPVFDTRLHEAVMFGAPCEGGELVFLTADGEGNPVVTRTRGPVRLPRRGPGPLAHAPNLDAIEEPAGAKQLLDDRAAEVAATLTPTGRPMRWGPGKAARAGGLAFTACAVVGTEFVTDTLLADGFGWHVLGFFGPFMLLNLAATLLNWRVTADSAGLWLTGAWKVRHVPWERLRGAAYTREGTVQIRVRDQDTWELPGIGWPWAERRLGLRPPYNRMTDEINALHTRPELRPIEQSPPRNHGLPLGPVLAVLLALTVLLSFLR
ncbi:hypothetical protein [Streptomyces sp. NPDC057582]|uniref:hypothetical protein n=1 Tax=Streptomyces sp. NPDC057582 TaxID=3346174 RepID=UPI0036AEAAD5